MNENNNAEVNVDRVFSEGQELLNPGGSGSAQGEAFAQQSGEVAHAYEQRQVPTNTTESSSQKVFHEDESQSENRYEISGERISEIVDKTLESQTPGEVRSEGVSEALTQFNGLDVDSKLAILYYLYEGMGDSVTPAAPEAANVVQIQGFFDQFDTLPMGDAQLEAMRALVRGEDNHLGREYGKHTENNKLFIWFLLAERMGKDVIGIPEGYRLSDAAQQSLEGIKELDFEQQITVLRDVAYAMGTKSGEFAR
ncbi:orange carotenoid protein N-terminal domain-containing protein [Gloeobacter morelensis]|uniref:OCP N-terminal domain-containing protein n=1 Tax=Gloeobacter morelensis MG652769 TaxID=2781736 RepID=A0ABY3PRD5_9CYAN|nr:orange carotenoid protein N-terminal domain-containing protein [Gloeobacter morelensis]UFP96283.1 hypothetical protein ISF26_08775 [Gloeobacter morelensis MG652769]